MAPKSPIEQFWQRYLDSLPPGSPHPAKYQPWLLADTPEDADHLAELVKSGKKTAIASLAWAYDWQNVPYPQPGDVGVITDWANNPLAVIVTTRVKVVPFDQVSAEFAAQEFEGAPSLDEWRNINWQIFEHECANIERKPSLDMPVVCEHFRLVYAED